MTKSERMLGHITAAEICGLAYSLEKVLNIEPTPYTEVLQADKTLDYIAELNAKVEVLNRIVSKYLGDEKAKMDSSRR